MIRVIVLTAAAAIALAVFVYGVVLNGFGLFDDPGRPEVAESADSPRRQAVDPGVAGRGNTRPVAGPDRAGAPDGSGSGAERTDPSDTSTTGPADQTEPRMARNVTPPNVLARPTSRYVDPASVQEADAEEADEEEADIRRYHQVIVRDAGTLESGDKTIRLTGVSPIAADRTCTDESGQTWPCGRVATAALRMLIRQRAVDCTVVSETDDEIVGNCSAGLQDINGWLVEQGWAEADPGAGYAEEADAARADKRGIYLARWEVKGTGGSGLQPPPSFTAPELPPQAYQAPAFPSPDAVRPADTGTSTQTAVERPAN